MRTWRRHWSTLTLLCRPQPRLTAKRGFGRTRTYTQGRQFHGDLSCLDRSLPRPRPRTRLELASTTLASTSTYILMATLPTSTDSLDARIRLSLPARAASVNLGPCSASYSSSRVGLAFFDRGSEFSRPEKARTSEKMTRILGNPRFPLPQC